MAVLVLVRTIVTTAYYAVLVLSTSTVAQIESILVVHLLINYVVPYAACTSSVLVCVPTTTTAARIFTLDHG